VLTLNELKERLAQEYDEVTLIDILGVTSEEIVEAFEDRILAKYNELEREVSDNGVSDKI